MKKPFCLFVGNTLGCVAVNFGLLWVGSAVLAQSPKRAPLNPKLVEYLARAGTGRPLLTIDGTPSYGLIPLPVDLSHLRGLESQSALTATLTFNPSYDLRTLGRVTPVRDQGDFGTCWAHATFGSLESCLLPDESNDFSENNLVNLAGFDLDFYNGGNAAMAMAYLTRWDGPINETDDAYPNPGGSPAGLTVRKHVQQVRIIPGKISDAGNDDLKQALMDHGALNVSYYHDDAYYNSTYKTYRYTGSEWDNHAVTLVGWDDNFDRNKFTIVPPGNGAYIVKNSWGTVWGNGGYFYVSYYDTTFARSETFAFLNAETTTNYARIYSYDPLGWIGSVGDGTTTTFWGANLFTNTAGESLGAVGFYASSVNTSYELYIYTGVLAGAPRSGTLAATKSGICSYPGYHTVSLDTPILLTAAQRFSIVLKLTTPGNEMPQTIEYAAPGYSSAATASPGQSYYSYTGTSWTDLTTFDATANFCIKGYAADSSDSPTVADWTFEEGVPGQSAALVRDSSGHGYDSIRILGTPRFVQSGTASQGSVSLFLPPGSGFEVLNSPAFNLPNEFTFEVTMRAEPNYFDNSSRYLIASFNPATGQSILGLGYKGIQRVAIFGELTSPVPDDGKSHHLAVVFNKPALSLYVDGNLIATYNFYPNLPPINNPMQIVVGSDYMGGFWFHGTIDRARISNKALAPQEFFIPFQPEVTLGLSGSPMAEATGVATVTATLATACGQSVTVNLAFSGTARLTDDYTRSGSSISIPAGSLSGSIQLSAVQDSLDEANETIVVDIDSVVNGTENGTQQITATISDDDEPPTVTLNLAGSLVEAGGVATVTATLSAISSLPVTVNLAFSGSALLAEDYTRSGANIIVPAWNLSGSITLLALQDSLYESNETIVVDIDSVVNGTENGAQQVVATITDDDLPPTVTLSLTGSPMAEAGGVAIVTATLSTASGLPVSVRLAFSGTATLMQDYTVEMDLNPAGGLSDSITLIAVPDYRHEANETIVVDIDSVINGTENGTQRVAAIIMDDDPSNQAPSFLKGADPVVAQNAGPSTLSTWATDIYPGPPAELDQQVHFLLTCDKDYLFASPPAINPGGALSFTPALNLRGKAIVTVRLQDDGGTYDNGQDTSTPQTFQITIGLPTDSNANRLPDDWEQAHGLTQAETSDPDGDPDGDGLTNVQEYASGTNPMDSSDSLQVAVDQQSGNIEAIRFKTVPGKIYRVEYNNDFPLEPWQPLSSYLTATGSVLEIPDPSAGTSPKRMYRVLVYP